MPGEAWDLQPGATSRVIQRRYEGAEGVMKNESATVRVAALADLHLSKVNAGTFQPILTQAAASADVLVLCGDLTEHGSPEEARLLSRELASIKVPMIGVLGNHDYEAGQPDEVRQVLQGMGVNMLDGDACEVHGV